MTAPARPTLVTPDARELLLVARAVAQGGPYEAVDPILRGATRLDGLPPTAMRVLEDTIAKGCALALARLGGWRRVARVTTTAGGERAVATGRAWEVHPIAGPALDFSPYTFELFRWLLTAPLGDPKPAPFTLSAPATAGDELVTYLVCALVEGRAVAPTVAAQPSVQRSALAWLGFPRLFAEAAASTSARPSPPTPRAFTRLLERGGALVLDALGDDLARRAVAFERHRARVQEPVRLRALSELRQAALDSYLDAVLAAGRDDLASFVVDAATVLLPRAVPTDAVASLWIAELDKAAPLRDRADARRASGAHLRALARLAQRRRELALVRFIDEGYDVAQVVLARWERIDNDGFSRAAEVLARLESLEGW